MNSICCARSVRAVNLLGCGRGRAQSPASHIPPCSIFSSTQASSPLRGNRLGKRAFHFEPTLTAAIQGTQDTLLNFHTITHTPWFLTIPLIAVGVNVLFRAPFSIYSHKILARRSKYALVMQGWNVRIQRDVQREGLLPSQRSSEVKSRFEKVTNRLYSRFGVQWWKLYGSFLSFPFWLVAIDGIRRLCGGPRGILGSLVGVSDEATSEGSDVGKGVDSAPTPLPDTTTADTMYDLGAVDPSTTTSMTEAVRNVVDPSLSTEGCLWFPDLTVADPYHVLPFAVSLMLLANLIPKSSGRAQEVLGLRRAEAEPDSGDGKMVSDGKWRARLHRGLIVVAGCVGPLTLDLPAALHIYWISSSAASWMITKLLDYWIPISVQLHDRCKGIELPVIRPRRNQEEEPKKTMHNKADKKHS